MSQTHAAPPSESVDVVIVGAGILGLAVAWELGRRGGRSVLVLDRHAPATQATAKAAALLTRARADAATAALVRATYDAVTALEAALGEDLGLRRVGTLHVAASSEKAAALRGLLTDSADPVAWLDGAGAAQLVPWLDPAAVTLAAHAPLDAYIDPYRLADAYGRAARRLGVRARGGVSVRGIRVADGRVLGVDTDGGFIQAPVVVNAAGAWAATLAATAGVGLPQAPVRSQYWITQARPDLFPRDCPITVLPDAGAYARPELGALLFGLRGGASFALDPACLPEDSNGLLLDDSDDGWTTLEAGWPGLARFCPALEQVGLAHYVAGLSTYTLDGRFVLGPVAAVRGLLMATGCCGAGIAASGGVGAAIAALAAGEDSPIDLSGFAPDRHGPVDPFAPALGAACAAARSGKTAG